METLKKVLEKLVNFGENLEKSLKDHKINLFEGATLAGNLGILVFFVIQNYEELREQYSDLTDEQMEEIKLYLRDELDLENDKIETVMEEGFDLVAAIILFVSKLNGK